MLKKLALDVVVGAIFVFIVTVMIAVFKDMNRALILIDMYISIGTITLVSLAMIGFYVRKLFEYIGRHNK